MYQNTESLRYLEVVTYAERTNFKFIQIMMRKNFSLNFGLQDLYFDKYGNLRKNKTASTSVTLVRASKSEIRQI